MIATNPRVRLWMQATGETSDNEGLHRFIVWLTRRWADYMTEHGRKPGDYPSDADQRDFDQWLAGWVEGEQSR